MNYKEIIQFNKINIGIANSEKGYQSSYFATRNFSRGEMIMQCYGRVVDHAVSLCSIQIDRGAYLLAEEWTGKNLNHSCEPNAYMNAGENEFPILYAMRDVKIGDEITFHYGMTEFAWDKNSQEKFMTCLCGAPTCKGKIQAFSQLSYRDQFALINSGLCMDHLVHSALRTEFIKKRLETVNMAVSGNRIAA